VIREDQRSRRATSHLRYAWVQEQQEPDQKAAKKSKRSEIGLDSG
jgi:hypothetical protein